MTLIDEETISAIAKLAAIDIQKQYPNVDYLRTTVEIAVLHAAQHVLEKDEK